MGFFSWLWGAQMKWNLKNVPKLCKLTNDIKYFGWQVEVVTAGGKKHYHLRYDWYDDINNPPIKFNEIIIKPRVVMADGHVDGNFSAFREVAVAILENNKYSDYYDKIYSLNYRSREDIYQETTERNRLCFECVRVLYGKFLLEREPVAQDGHRGIKADEFEAFKELMGTAVYYLRKSSGSMSTGVNEVWLSAGYIHFIVDMEKIKSFKWLHKMLDAQFNKKQIEDNVFLISIPESSGWLD